LADDFWRVAHDDATGRRHGDLAMVSLGLGAAVLGELWLAGAVHLDQGVLQVVPGGPAPADGLTWGVLERLAGERTDRTVASWLAWLRTEAYEAVAHRMATLGHLRRAGRRREWIPTDALTAAGPGTVLRVKLVQDQPLDGRELCLAGLICTCGLAQTFLSTVWQPEPVRGRLGWWLSHPGLHPGLADLLQHTRAAATRATMTAR
jgi:hypothetical protein